MKRWAVILALLVLVAGIGIGWKVYAKLYQTKGPDGKKGPVAVAVEVVPVRQATIRDIAQFTGGLAARSQFVVAPKVAGRLVKLHADIGDTIENGQVIAVLDDEEYRQQVEQAKAELEVARASVDEARSTLEAAQREFDRVEALRAKKIASESELDGARSQYRTALARQKVALSQVAQQEAALRTAEVRLSYTRIEARWDGGGQTRTIGERFADEGTMLAANTPIVSVIDLDELTAVIHVAEREYAKLHVGQQVDVSCYAWLDKQFVGEVVRMAPLVKDTSREARVEIRVPNAERLLRPGMFVLARIELARHENSTVVPRVAVVQREDKKGVFLADGRGAKAVFVQVTTGVQEGALLQILRPALEGRVVTLGQHLLEDGTGIVISEPAQAAKVSSSRPAETSSHRPSAASQPAGVAAAPAGAAS